MYLYSSSKKSQHRGVTIGSEIECKTARIATEPTRGKVAGFTLPEMLISLAIVGAILSVVLTSQSTYTEEAALANLANNISLFVSQAQIYGVGVREISPGSDDFSAAYGMDFRLLGAGGSDDAYVFFADRNGDQIYSGSWDCPLGGSSECLEKISISSGNFVSSLCVIHTDDTESCDIGRVSLSFLRPDIRSRLVFFTQAGVSTSPSNVKGARIYVESPSGSTRSVSVYTTGYVSTQ